MKKHRKIREYRHLAAILVFAGAVLCAAGSSAGAGRPGAETEKAESTEQADTESEKTTGTGQTDTQTVETKTGGPARTVIRVMSIVGNELTYTLSETDSLPERNTDGRPVEGFSGQEDSSSGEGETTDTTAPERRETGRSKEDGTGTGSRLGRTGTAGDAENEPSGGTRVMGPGGKAGEESRPERADSSERTMPGGVEKAERSRQGVTAYLPVAVPVHTDTGKVMTFSILQAGDELEVTMEELDGEQIITEIWMVGAEDTGS